MLFFGKKKDRDSGSLDDHFATQFAQNDADTRREMLQSLINYTNRFWLVKRARNISRILKERNVSFGTLYDFEIGLARLLHPRSRRHIAAGYFYGPYFQKRAEPFSREIAELAGRNELNPRSLSGILARIEKNEGHEMALIFLDEVVRSYDRMLAGQLKEIERGQFRLKQEALAHREQARDLVEADFLSCLRRRGRAGAVMYITRLEQNPVLHGFANHLRDLLKQNDERDAAEHEFQDSLSALDQERPGIVAEATGDAAATSEWNNTADGVVDTDTTDDSIDEEKAGVDYSDESTAAESPAEEPPEDLIAAAPSTVPPESQLSETQYLDSEDAEDQTSAGEESAYAEPVVLPSTDDGELAELAAQSGEHVTDELEVYLEDKRNELSDIEAQLSRSMDEVRAEAQAILAIKDPEERFNRAIQAYNNDRFQEHHREFEQILTVPENLFGRLMGMLSNMARRLTPAEMRAFMDHLIEQLRQDEALIAREPNLIPRLLNYRDSFQDAPPELLKQVHMRLAELEQQHRQDLKARIQAQTDYLSACLADEEFKPVWPTIFTIYQNIVHQKFDAQLFDEIAPFSLDKQVHILSALRTGFPERTHARKAIDRRLRGQELAQMAGRMAQEEERGRALPVSDIRQLLHRAFHGDPVREIKKNI
ncbi:MAG: hypothetical protein KDK30_12875, partial [Leptospiraceae bacterium]|nr:hypothetical protein [Leptospiraceae bacterium]